MKNFVTLVLLILLFPISVTAHTTVLIPHTNEDGQKTIKVLHFHPSTGSDLMGIRLDVEDSKYLKGLDSIFMIHQGEEKKLHTVAIPDYYTVRDEKRETYTIPINNKSGFSGPGDYIIVVKHKAHWKIQEELYRQKVAKFCLNYGRFITDWPKRLLKNAPEIIPLVPPYSVYAGSLFRAETVNDEGKLIPHARIQVEYLNYKLGDMALDTTTIGFIKEDIVNTIILTDSNGGFSFVPPKEGVWTFTLLDGDNNKLVQGKRLEYDSSLSILVNQNEE